jgi:putative pyruvate formate lyase activating enzyme
VSPTHVVPQILAALLIAANAGLRLPLVYNTGGFESCAALELLEDAVDIYMPDMKYAASGPALRLSRAASYPEVNRAAVVEMHRQVGDLILDERGVARRGLLVRHLVLPGGMAGTAEVCRFLVERVSRDTYVNLMDQYRPCYKARDIPPLDRVVSRLEFAQALAEARSAGLHRFDRRGSRWTGSAAG